MHMNSDGQAQENAPPAPAAGEAPLAPAPSLPPSPQPTPDPTHAATPAPDAVPIDDQASQRPSLTPGFIIASLTPERMAHVSALLDSPDAPNRGSSPSLRLLALLNDTELRTLATRVGLPSDGNFVDLYRRLSRYL